MRDPWLSQRQAFHDAANWLTVLLGHVEALQDEPGSQRHLELARRAARAAHRLCALPPGPGRASGSVDPGRIASRLVLHFGTVAAAAGVELQVDAQSSASVQADPPGFEDALMNLIRNALEATPEGGRVVIVVREAAAGFVQVRVEDGGAGIPATEREQLGKPGRSSKSGTDRGLGLSRVSAWLADMGVRLEVDDAPAGGASIGFTLAVAATRVAESSRAGGARILLVEDDLAVAEVLSLLLAVDGHGVEQHGDLESALAAFEPGRFDLVLCDQNLPDGAGAELLERVAEIDPALVCFLVTGAPESVNSRFRSRFGVLAKPVSREDLRRTVKSAIRAPLSPDDARSDEAQTGTP